MYFLLRSYNTIQKKRDHELSIVYLLHPLTSTMTCMGIIEVLGALFGIPVILMPTIPLQSSVSCRTLKNVRHETMVGRKWGQHKHPTFAANIA